MTQKQLKYTRSLLEREGISFMEVELALQFSKGRTKELVKLTHLETQELIGEFVTPSSEDKMRGKLLSMAHELRWELPNGKVDMQRLTRWLIKYTPHKKTFNELKADELPIVVSVFERMYKGYLKSY